MTGSTAAGAVGSAHGDEQWRNWRWQQRSAVRSGEELRELFPGISASDIEAVERHTPRMRFQVTRHYLSRIQRTSDGAPDPGDPLWRQILPVEQDRQSASAYSYDGTENWEMPDEMVTPIAQRKYEDRLIIRASNVCHAYCQFCYEALRTLETEGNKPSFNLRHWDATLAYIEDCPEIQEVILSGGEPLMQGDSQISRLLSDLRSLNRPMAIRLHTRALSFNPFRVTDELCEVFREFNLNAIGLHVAHVNELGPEFESACVKLQQVVPVLFANIPLLRGVNDSAESIHALGMRLYMLGVARGYLYHFMPHSPSADRFRTPVQTGVEITGQLKRRVSNLAVPEYVLPHHTGKFTMPLLAADQAPPTRQRTAEGEWVVQYVNWLGDTVLYPDPPIEPQPTSTNHELGASQ